jgi:hypothetical protein
MTLAPMKESRPMKHVADRAQDPERPQSLEELRRRLNRRLSDLGDGWRHCDHQPCRRWRQCRGDGPDFTCTGDGSPRRTVSREETAQVMSELYKEVRRRCADFAAGAKPPDEEELRKLRDNARTAALRRRKSAQAGAAAHAADCSQPHTAETPAPVAGEMQLAEKQERINRACNEPVAAPDRARAPGPRITRL